MQQIELYVSKEVFDGHIRLIEKTASAHKLEIISLEITEKNVHKHSYKTSEVQKKIYDCVCVVVDGNSNDIAAWKELIQSTER